MDPQRYARVKEVFREAMRWAPEERAAAVAELAGADLGLRDEVMSLLAHHDDAPLIREPAPSVARIADAAAGVVEPAAAVAASSSAASEPASGASSSEPASASGASSSAASEPSSSSSSSAASGASSSAASGASASAASSSEPASASGAAGPAAAAGGGETGRTLAELLRAERAGGAAAGWPLERVVDTLEPIALALAKIAERGGVHGAVRAERILVAEVGGELRARLGAAAGGAAGGAAGPARLEGAAAAAAAPEQLSPALGPTGPWSDVYALALLCVELMLGRPVVEGAASAALARTREETRPPTPRAVGLAVRSAIEAVMAMALAMRPMERYQNVGRFWAALGEAIAASRHALPTGAPGAMLPLASAPRSSGPRDRAAAAPPRRWRAWALLVAVAVGAVALAAARWL